MSNLVTISASKLKTYKFCGRKYRYNYIDREPSTTNVGAIKGTALHKAIETHYRDGKNAPAVFQNRYLSEIQKAEDKGQKVIGEQYTSMGIREGKKILQTFPWDNFKPMMINGVMAIETEFTLPFPNARQPIVLINGYMDWIDETWRVIDWKSGKRTPTADDMAHDPQFIIYYWAFNELLGNPPIDVIYYELGKHVQHSTNVSHNYDFKIEQLTEDIYDLLTAKHFARKPKDSKCVSECSYAHLCFGDKFVAPIDEEEAVLEGED